MREESEDHFLHALAGATGSALALGLTYPLYLVTIRQQADHNSSSLANDSGNCEHKVLGSSILCVLTDAVRNDGIAGLFRGCSEGLWATSAQSFVYYYVFAMLKHWHRSPDASPFWNLVTGYEAGVVTVLLTHPLWVMNYELAAGEPADKSLSPSAACLRHAAMQRIWQEHGWHGFYRGVLPALALCINPAFQFATYAALTNIVMLLRRRHATTLSSADNFFLGAAAKALAATATYPLQIVKTSLAIASKERAAAGSGSESAVAFRGPLDCVRAIIVREGIGGFFKGLRGKLLQTTLTAAMTMMLRLYVLASLRRTRAAVFRARRQLRSAP
eukprot:gnl/TRDRNA2_/TRDRNA2_147226_c0_seq1.p1 gnl/TRDRNA2_/TRDRNA2_147226_c0~~gnl/TRDRNA2_/TRDRNA2_147226_c0_seq1.p1  ORF type:complete len:331 (-),score=35.96 gnl/TRDRNA2_/TRDRNA2_147226_c0_seq1:12-1004(-)